MKIRGEEVKTGAFITEFRAGGEALFGPILRADGQVGAATDDPVDFLSDDRSFGRRVGTDGDQEPALALVGVDRVRHIR